MHRKDCDSLTHDSGAVRGGWALYGIAALAVALMTQPSAGAAVRMWSKTVIDGDEIRVQDVAKVFDAVLGQAERYGGVAIKPAPEPGKNGQVSLDELREALVRAGANPTEFTVRGATLCCVVRPLTLRVVDAESESPAASRYWWPAGSTKRRGNTTDGGPSTRSPASLPGEVTVAMPPAEGSASSLEELLRKFVADRLSDFGGQVHLRFSSNARQALTLCRPEYDFRIHWRNERRLGACSLAVDIVKDGRLERTLDMVVEVSVTLPVVVTARPVNRGQAIRAQDVQLEDRDFFHLDRIGLTDPSRAVGQQSRRLIRKGEIVRHRDLKPCPLVERGDLVTVWSQVGGMRIKTVVKALEAGMYGQTIQARNESSRERLHVIVTGPQTATVAGAGRRVSLATSSGREGG